MYKKRNKEILQLILLIITIVSIPLIFITFETIEKLRAVSNIDTEEIVSNTFDELYNKINTLPKNEDPSKIRKQITEIFELMNKKDFTSLYSLLTDDMKELMFPTEESFITHMTDYLNGESYSPSFSTYEKLNKEEKTIFIVKVKYLPYTTNEEDILNTSAKITDTFTLYQLNEKEFRYSFLNYIGTETTESTFENDVLKTTIKATHLYTTQTQFNIEITNKSDSDMYIGENRIFCITGLMSKPYPSSVYIPPNSSTTITHIIYTGFSLKDSLPQTITFRGPQINDIVYLFSLPVKYPINLS